MGLAKTAFEVFIILKKKKKKNVFIRPLNSLNSSHAIWWHLWEERPIQKNTIPQGSKDFAESIEAKVLFTFKLGA